MKSFSKLFSKAKTAKFRGNEVNNASNPSYEAYRHFDAGGDATAPSSHASPQGGRRYRERSGYERKCGTLMNIISGLAVISVVGMLAHLIAMLKSSANTRILWPHNVMLKAWPTTSSKTIPLYLLLAAASIAALVNIGALIVTICVKNTTWSKSRNIAALTIRVSTTVLLLAGIIALAVHDPNLWSWSCDNKYIESDTENNVIGFETVCSELSAVFGAAVFAALLEFFSVIEAVYFVKFRGRKLKSEGQLPRQLKIYERIDPVAREQDEIPMLDRDRKSGNFERPDQEAYEPNDEWNASMLEVGRGSMQ